MAKLKITAARALTARLLHWTPPYSSESAGFGALVLLLN